MLSVDVMHVLSCGTEMPYQHGFLEELSPTRDKPVVQSSPKSVGNSWTRPVVILVRARKEDNAYSK